MEANDGKRNKYQAIIKDIPKESIVYIDESGIDQTVCKDKGWGKKGQKLLGKISGKRYERTNIIAGYVNKSIIAPMIFSGSCNTEVFEAWVEQFLIKELKAGQTVIMDNAAFHKSKKACELIESTGCNLIFLPPYSPDLNPIEKFWANMKRWIKNKIGVYQNLYSTICAFFSVP